MPQDSSDPRARIFVIHGRNGLALDSIRAFLHSLGLECVTFIEVAGTMRPDATIGEVVVQGIAQTWATLVLLTPDEGSILRRGCWSSEDVPVDRGRWQARPNVLFEAGLALAAKKERVIIVALGKVRMFSDITGALVLRPNNEPSSDRATLRKQLGKVLGCSVVDNDAWMRAGDFECCRGPRWTPREHLIASGVALLFAGGGMGAGLTYVVSNAQEAPRVASAPEPEEPIASSTPEAGSTGMAEDVARCIELPPSRSEGWPQREKIERGAARTVLTADVGVKHVDVYVPESDERADCHVLHYRASYEGAFEGSFGGYDGHRLEIMDVNNDGTSDLVFSTQNEPRRFRVHLGKICTRQGEDLVAWQPAGDRPLEPFDINVLGHSSPTFDCSAVWLEVVDH